MANASIQFYKIFTLRPYDDAISHSHILNKAVLADVIHCRIPDEQFYDLEFIECGEIARAVISAEHVHMNEQYPWIDIDTSALNQEIGSHMYQFIFRNKRFGETMYMYLYYVMQNDNPEKSYIYMERDNS